MSSALDREVGWMQVQLGRRRYGEEDAEVGEEKREDDSSEGNELKYIGSHQTH